MMHFKRGKDGKAYDFSNEKLVKGVEKTILDYMFYLREKKGGASITPEELDKAIVLDMPATEYLRDMAERGLVVCFPASKGDIYHINPKIIEQSRKIDIDKLFETASKLDFYSLERKLHAGII